MQPWARLLMSTGASHQKSWPSRLHIYHLQILEDKENNSLMSRSVASKETLPTSMVLICNDNRKHDFRNLDDNSKLST
ncbi:hypothetical protein V6N12_046735 [Hibiscus sabdariffa]|uniref:Uncharacterized protein n=1 Tax=Hibiscus sabdariffa TaxID=183260 RepID=A0ABR2AST5_9ROSI